MPTDAPKFEITTGARLHFGLLANNLASGRGFGGAGMMIDRPGFQVRVEEFDSDTIVGSANVHDHLGRVLRKYRARCPVDNPLPSVRIEITREIPAHIGFGSGTQLGMAVAKALSLCAGERDVSSVELARRIGRGARSAIGIHGFGEGGFLVDGGKLNSDEISPRVARHDVPSGWRFVLMTPPAMAGLSGLAEINAFERLPPMPQTTTDRLCGIVVMQMIPALANADCDRFGDAVYEFGQIAGQYFSAVQAGIYADQRMSDLVRQLRNHAIHGVGQTSWGPTIFAVCADDDSAASLAAELKRDNRWSDCAIQVAAALNRGA